LPKNESESGYLNREFITFSGAMILFLLGLVIALGTSSPIIGRIFVSNPTPPAISFYNNWTYPFAIFAALMTVVGQYVFWKRQNMESLAGQLLLPAILACITSMITIFVAHITWWFPMGLLFAGCFAVFGNFIIMVRLLWRKPRLIGGSFSHIGFGVMLLGIMASTLFNNNLLDTSTRSYNAAVAQGQMTDGKGHRVRQKANFVQLKLNKPTVVNNKYKLTYKGYTLKDQARVGEQQYRIRVQPLHGKGKGQGFNMHPQVYPMSQAAPGGKVSWSVDSDVHSSFTHDIYLYVAGSSYVQWLNKKIAEHSKERKLGKPAADVVHSDSAKALKISLKKGQTISEGVFTITLKAFKQADLKGKKGMLRHSKVAVRAILRVKRKASSAAHTVKPLFVVYSDKGKNWSYSPAADVGNEDISFRFTKIDPQTGKMTFRVKGINAHHKKAWILVIAQEKPFISLVWIGTFMVMFGFSVSIFRHWDRERKRW